MTIYERLGGETAVAALLEALYVRALADPLFTRFFEKIDMQRLKAHQFAFISQAVGGPRQYSGPSLVQAHARLRIGQRDFDAFVEHLRNALLEIGASEDLAAEILSQVTPLSGVIVSQQTVTRGSEVTGEEASSSSDRDVDVGIRAMAELSDRGGAQDGQRIAESQRAHSENC
jgi:truncated hemoglobin YjbI